MIKISKEKKIITADLDFLKNLIAFTSTSLDMEVDISLYKDKIIDDFLFINKTLSKIEEKIINNTIEEKEFIEILKKLKNVKDGAIILMESIIKIKYKHALIFEAHSKDIKSYITQYKNSSAEIEKRVNRKYYYPQTTNQVSKEELNFLFEQKESQIIAEQKLHHAI